MTESLHHANTHDTSNVQVHPGSYAPVPENLSQVPQVAPSAAPAAALYDFSYRRTPNRYIVPEEHRRPYGDTTGEIRGPGYFYAVGSFAAAIIGFSLTCFSTLQVLALSAAHSSYRYIGYIDYEFTTVANNMLLALVPVVLACWLGILAFSINKGRVTPMTGRMRTFAILGIVLAALELVGIGMNLFLYIIFMP